jgi:transposase
MQVSGSSVEVVSSDPEIVARVAAVDVGKDAGVVCLRVPRESMPGQRGTRVWTVPSRTTSIAELADQLAELGVERIVLEATSDYWRPFYYLLEARGLTVWLVNAREVKNVPGRPKTDKLDAV